MTGTTNLVLISCAAAALGASEPRPATVPSPADLSPSYLYLRCNATGWEVNERDRLRPTANPDIFELTFDVTEPWMVSTGDDCVVTETPELDGWGAWQHAYVVARAPLAVPTSSRLGLLPAADPPSTFKVRYPELGRFHALVNRAARSISILRAGLHGPGDVLWTAPGSLVLDRAARLYQLDYSATPERLVRLDRLTGRELWRYAPGAFLTVDGTCSGGTELLVRAQPAFVALDPATGAVLWSTTLDSARHDDAATAYPHCKADLDFFTVGYGDRSEKLAAVDWATGQTLWTYTGGQDPEVLAMTSEHVTLFSTRSGGARLVQLDARTGQVQWTLDRAEFPFWVAATDDGQLISTAAHRVSRIDEETGRVSWTVTAQDEYPFVSFEGGGLYLRERSRFRRLDPATGASLWAYPFEATDLASPTAAVLPDASVLLAAATATGRDGLLVMLEPNGAVRWSRLIPDSAATPVRDDQGRLYVRSFRHLTRLNPWTGDVLWTHEQPLAHPELGGGLGPIEDSDASSVYVVAFESGEHYAPMSLLALDASTGKLRWRDDEPGAINVIGADALRLYTLTGYFETVVKILAKSGP